MSVKHSVHITVQYMSAFNRYFCLFLKAIKKNPKLRTCCLTIVLNVYMYSVACLFNRFCNLNFCLIHVCTDIYILNWEFHEKKTFLL